jgi:ABC-2 type transport system permease protein
MRAALVIAFKDLRQRFRDRSAVAVAFVAPLLLALIVTGAFGSGFAGEFSATYTVVDHDASELSKAFADRVLGAPQFKEQISVVKAKDDAEAHRLVREDKVSAAFVVPKGFAAAVTANRKTSIAVLRNPDAEVGSAVAVALAGAYTDQINAGRLAVLTTIRAGGVSTDPAAVGELARTASRERIPVELVDGNIGLRKVSGASYFGPAMAIFFLFFTTSFAARSLLAERELGTMPRVLAAPIGRESVIAGKALTGFAIGVTSLAVMFVTFRLLLNVRWGDPLAVVVLSISTVLAVMGLTSVVQVFARTQQQADAYSTVVSVLLALLGGSFFPLFQMPELVQRLSVITPNGWAMRGYMDIVYDGASLGDLGTHLAVILGFAVVTGAISAARARRLGFQ